MIVLSKLCFNVITLGHPPYLFNYFLAKVLNRVICLRLHSIYDGSLRKRYEKKGTFQEIGFSLFLCPVISYYYTDFFQYYTTFFLNFTTKTRFHPSQT